MEAPSLPAWQGGLFCYPVLFVNYFLLKRPWFARLCYFRQYSKVVYLYICCCCLVAKSCPTFSVLWTIACQTPLSIAFSRQEYWSGIYPKGSSWIGDRTHVSYVSYIGRQILDHWVTSKPQLYISVCKCTPFRFFFINYDKTLSIVLCAIHYVFVIYFIYFTLYLCTSNS